MMVDEEEAWEDDGIGDGPRDIVAVGRVVCASEVRGTGVTGGSAVVLPSRRSSSLYHRVGLLRFDFVYEDRVDLGG